METCKFLSVFSVIFILTGLTGLLNASAPLAPVIDKVLPMEGNPVRQTAGVFFFDDFEGREGLKRYHDVGRAGGRFRVSEKDAFSGKRSLEMAYLSKEKMLASGHKDPGNAGWCWRFFGDNPKTRRIPPDQRHKYKVVVARWYHKFPEGFMPRDGKHWPPKMARMRAFTHGEWHGAYTFLFWTAGPDGHISIERHTRSPRAHREWLPNYATKFRFSDPVNQGRWIHFEFRIEIGDKPRSDKWQVWADGVMVGEATTDDMTGGWQRFCLNGMSWDTYWNGGSPVGQSRFYDDLALSTKPIGPVRTPLNPVIFTGAFRDADKGDTLKRWEVEVAATTQKPLICLKRLDGVEFRAKSAEFERVIVWRGQADGMLKSIIVDTNRGRFLGPLKGKTHLEPNQLYTCRIRHQDSSGKWSKWSPWHAAFATVWARGTPKDKRLPPKGFYLGQAAKDIKR